MDRSTGKSKGLAFVRFSTEEAQSAAVELSGTEHLGRSLTIEKATPKEQRPPAGDRGNSSGRPQQTSQKDPTSSTIFVGNLSYETTEDSLKTFFSRVGTVKAVRVAMDADGNV